MKNLLLPTLLFLSYFTQAQTNVRAWYADGQVWVVWESALPLPDWYEIYAKPTAFSSTNTAVRVGKSHLFEYSCAALKEQVDPAQTPRIPSPTGIGKYQLALNEALFVFTPHQMGALFFAVVADGNTQVNAGQNITATAVPFQYNPVGDPVECHLQAVFPSPFAAGFNCFAFLMWSDGRQNQWENRPDFPVMANAAKNGMPNLFFVSAPVGLDTTQPFAMTLWLHGGGNVARQSLAGSRPEINIRPVDGILVAHNDDVFGWRNPHPPNFENASWHFGWRKNYDPFSPDNFPTGPDTIVNYTQRRYLWIDSWLIKNFNIDPKRIQIQGHSMGSAGVLALAKCYPEHYASVTIFNTGCGGPEPGDMVPVFGEPTQNFPTNLKNRAGETVHLLNLWNMLDNCSSARDFPPIRHWHGKSDDNGTMRWDAYVVENYRKADSLGLGFQNMWSERGHAWGDIPMINDHWANGIQPTLQTALDDVVFAESRFRSDLSFPAFFNHRLDQNNNDPGTGLFGINNGDGDNWGAWGGYHRWGKNSIVDQAGAWSVVAWLESNAVFVNDNCPNNQLRADLAIRRPQNFHPATGKTLDWTVEDAVTGMLLQGGQTTVQANNLVVIPQVLVFKESNRHVKITVKDPSVATHETGNDFSTFSVFPNPTNGALYLTASFEAARVFDLNGEVMMEKRGSNETALDVSILQNGLYFLEILDNMGTRKIGRFVKE
jgi:Secretion system C-terminal sorting domain/Putative esterase